VEGEAISVSDARPQKLSQSLLGALQVAGTLLLSPLPRSWYNHWGASEAEVASSLPGDELILHPQQGYTRAVTVRATAAAVWPWLVQMGQGRGGLYSYGGLENLACSRDLAVMWRLVEPVDFVMGRKMLLSLKKLAEPRA